MRPALAINLLLLSGICAAVAPDLSIQTEGAELYLQIILTPDSASAALLTITPEQLLQATGNQFTLLENLTIEINASNTTFLYSIDQSSKEPLYSGSTNLWCGSVYDSCGNCNGMPPGTFKWCNANWPETSYYCDNWCYSFSPSQQYELARSSAYVGSKYLAEIKLSKGNKQFTLSSTTPAYSEPNLAASSSSPASPLSVSALLVRSLSSINWRKISDVQLQNYRNSLSYYYSQYAVSIGSAFTATNSLNGALSSMLNGAEGTESEYYEYAPATPVLPQIQLKLQAQYAGLIAIRGNPKALQLQNTVKFEGGQPFFEFQVQNIGAIADAFSGNLSCNNFSIITPPLTIAANELSNLKFFTPQFNSPQACVATVYVSESPQLQDSLAAILKPFKLPCPSEKQCCALISETYEERACNSEQKFKQEDPYGNGYYYLQNYACEDFTCKDSSITLLRRVSDRTPPPQSYSFTSPGNSYQNAPSPSIQSSQNPGTSPSPSASPPNNSNAHLKIPESAIEILLPNELQEGYHEVKVTDASSPASGDLELQSPSEKSYAFPLKNGAATVLFNELGRWKVAFADELRAVSIIPVTLPSPTSSPQLSSTTSMIALDFSSMPLTEAALLISFLIFGFAAFRKYGERISFRKSYENNIVRLEINNSKSDLVNLEITDIVPEGTVLSTISNPPSEVTEIIFGKHIKWKRGHLGKGEKMVISYSIFSNDKYAPLRPAELLAQTDGNLSVHVLSNAVDA